MQRKLCLAAMNATATPWRPASTMTRGHEEIQANGAWYPVEYGKGAVLPLPRWRLPCLLGQRDGKTYTARGPQPTYHSCDAADSGDAAVATSITIRATNDGISYFQNASTKIVRERKTAVHHSDHGSADAIGRRLVPPGTGRTRPSSGQAL
jgi:hypothetical protein